MSPYYSPSRSFSSFASFNVSYSQEGSSLVSNLGNVVCLAPNNAGMTQKLLYLASLLS